MKIIKFESISIKNFLSIGDTEVKIDFKNGVNFITGENKDVPDTKNAVGKSSVIEAFNFAIFGNTLKGLKKDQIANNITGNTTEVKLKFNCNSPKGNNNFEIIRTINPSSLKVLKDGKDKTRDSIPNTTKYISEVLSSSQDIFKNCIIMQANNTIPFMAQGKVEKKKFIEGLFNLDSITKMFKLVKNDINKTKNDYEIESKLLNQIESNIITYQLKLDNQKKLIDESKSNKNKEYKTLLEEKENLKKIILKNKEENNSITLEDLKEKLEKAKKNLEKFINIENDLKIKKGIQENNINSLKDNIKKLNSKGAVCPTCGKPYDDYNEEQIKKTESEFNLKIKEIESNIEKLDQLLITALDKKNNFKKYINKTEDEIYDYNSRVRIIESSEDKIEVIDSKLNRINDNQEVDISGIKVFEELIENAQKEKKIKEDSIKIINNDLSKFEIARFILSEEGIRAYIIKKLLNLLNFRIKYYLSKMNSQYSLEFNEVFEDEIKNKKGLLMSYGNLSGAESKMMDLACIWAFRDILKLQGAVTYNISFYDEILDSSMDAKNSEIVCNILNEFAIKNKEMIYLISHKTDLLKAINGEVIKLQKSKGITIRV